MQRDLDLVRLILIEMEKWGPENRGEEITIPDRKPEEITYHLGLMSEAGLIQAAKATSFVGEEWIPIKILWDGHEFLDAARSETIWVKAKDSVLRSTGTLTLDALKVALGMAMKRAITGSF